MTSTAIAALADQARARAATLETQISDAQRSLAQAVLSGSSKNLDVVDHLRAQIRRERDVIAGLELLEVSARHQEAQSELADLTAERETVAAQVNALESEIEQKSRPPFGVERQDELALLRSRLYDARSQLADIDASLLGNSLNGKIR